MRIQRSSFNAKSSRAALGTLSKVTPKTVPSTVIASPDFAFAATSSGVGLAELVVLQAIATTPAPSAATKTRDGRIDDPYDRSRSGRRIYLHERDPAARI